MPHPNFDAALLDGDDTLFMTSHLYMRLYEDELARHGHAFDENERKHSLGKPSVLMFQRWNILYELGRDYLKWYEEFRERLYGSYIHQATMRDGATALLDVLEAHGIPHALVTNAPLSHVETLAELFPRLKRFPWVTRDDARLMHGEHKPNKRHFELGAETLGVQITRCVMFGDTDNDTDGGRNAGCYVVGLPHSYSLAENLGSAHFLLPDLRNFHLGMIPPLPFNPQR